MVNNLVLINGVDKDNKELSVRIENGIVKELGPKVNEADATVINLEKKLLTQSLVDIHVHLREPGFESKGTIKEETLAAARGGYGLVCAMPNLNPAPSSKEIMDKINKIIDDEASTKVLQIANITKDGLGEEILDDYKISFSYSDDGKGVADTPTLKKAMEEIKKENLMMMMHSEDENFIKVFNGRNKDMPSECEWKQLERDIELVRDTKCNYHLCHISNKKSVELIKGAKKDNLPVTTEVCPHHLILSEDDIDYKDGTYKVNPPLRSKEDVKSLIDAFNDGTIDVIVTDHAPHEPEGKAKPFDEASFGYIGSDFAFPLLYTKLVKTNKIKLPRLLEAMTTLPLKVINVDMNKLEVGKKANIAVFDLETTKPVKDNLKGKQTNTPFINEQLEGWNVLTINEGKITYNDLFKGGN